LVKKKGGADGGNTIGAIYINGKKRVIHPDERSKGGHRGVPCEDKNGRKRVNEKTKIKAEERKSVKGTKGNKGGLTPRDQESCLVGGKGGKRKKG